MIINERYNIYTYKVDKGISFAVEGPDELNKVMLIFVLNFLLLHAQVIVILEVGVHNHLVQMTNDPDLGVSLYVVLSPLLELAFPHVHLRTVHNLHKQSVIVLEINNVPTLCIFDHLK